VERRAVLELDAEDESQAALTFFDGDTVDL